MLLHEGKKRVDKFEGSPLLAVSGRFLTYMAAAAIRLLISVTCTAHTVLWLFGSCFRLIFQTHPFAGSSKKVFKYTNKSIKLIKCKINIKFGALSGAITWKGGVDVNLQLLKRVSNMTITDIYQLPAWSIILAASLMFWFVYIDINSLKYYSWFWR